MDNTKPRKPTERTKYQQALIDLMTDLKYMKKEELEVGQAYAVRARNFQIAIWDGKQFNGLRFKFTDSYMDTENHYDDPKYGTVKPLYKLT